MTGNKVHNKIVEFAPPEITFTQFYSFLMESRPEKPIWVKWNKIDGDETTRRVNWGPGPSGNALYDYEALDYMVVQSIDNNGDWRTIDLQGVLECRWEGKRYSVR